MLGSDAMLKRMGRKYAQYCTDCFCKFFTGHYPRLSIDEGWIPTPISEICVNTVELSYKHCHCKDGTSSRFELTSLYFRS